jgi:hypothetical protein
MDQGVAAILGAGVGVLGTLGTALLTYGATKQQVRIQGRLSHAQWLRDARQVAYSRFNIACHKTGVAVESWLEAVRTARQTVATPAAAALRAQRSAVETAFSEANRESIQVAIAGPADLASKADEIMDAFRDIFGEMDGLVDELPLRAAPPPGQYDVIRQMMMRCDLAGDRFQEGARQVLETMSA